MSGRHSAYLVGVVLGVIVWAITWSMASAGTFGNATAFFGTFFTTGSNTTTNLSDIYSHPSTAVFPNTNCGSYDDAYYFGTYPDQSTVTLSSSGSCSNGVAMAAFSTDAHGNGDYWVLYENAANNVSFYSTFTFVAGTWYGGIDFGAFTLGATSTVFAPTGTSTPVISCTDGNFLNNSFCQMFAYLFAPSNESLAQYGTIIAVYQKKPPLGYFGAVRDEFSVFSSSTLATSTQFAALAAAGTLLPTIFTPLDEGLAGVILVLLAFWIFHRIRHFNVTSP